MYAKNNYKQQRWSSDSIIDKTGPVYFKVKLQDDKVIRCHQDQLRLRYTIDSELPVLNDDDINMFLVLKSLIFPMMKTLLILQLNIMIRIHRPPTCHIKESDI